jgi:hypothetical protein
MLIEQQDILHLELEPEHWQQQDNRKNGKGDPVEPVPVSGMNFKKVLDQVGSKKTMDHAIKYPHSGQNKIITHVQNKPRLKIFRLNLTNFLIINIPVFL